MKRAKQLTTCLPNKPGALTALCRALADAKVNILAISVVDATEACLVRVVPDDAKTAASALEAAGIASSQRSVRLVELPNKIGALAEATERLSKRNVNIDFLYGAAVRPGGKAVIVMDAHRT